MFFGGGLVGIAILVLWVYCILDVIAADASLIRNLPKLPWLFIVIFLPTIGSVAWLILGRPQGAGFVPGDTRTQAPRPQIRRERRPPRPVYEPEPIRPQDSEEWANKRENFLKSWEEDLRRREEELRKQGDQPDDASPA